MQHERSYPRRHLTTSYWSADTSRPLLDWTLVDALRHAAATVPDRVALVEGRPDGAPGRRWTYAELLAWSERVAAALLSRFEPGDRVAFWAANVPEWESMFFGCAMAGVVLVTVNPAYKARELDDQLRKADPVALFTMDAYRGYDTLAAAESVRDGLPRLREVIRISEFGAFLEKAPARAALPSVAPLDPCVIMFTSGTTGVQKGVMFHHKAIVNMSLFTQERGGLAEGGVYVNAMPMFHIGGLGHATVGSLMRLATNVLVSEWEPTRFMSLVERERGTYSMLVPTMIETILAHPERPRFDLSTLKNIVSGAAVVEASLIRRTRAQLGSTICNVYGQTEMQGVVTAVRPDDTEADQAETIGQPLPQVEIKIADIQTGAVLPLGAQGEICMRGYPAMIGYFNMPEATAATVTPDGWVRSGDLGSMDERGYLRITGRIKEMIIRGGENIYPREIESLLLEDPRVAVAAVVGAPDPVLGEIVCAVIQPKDPANPPAPKELHAFCRSQLAAYKTPRVWYFVESLPYTATGKLQKTRLVEAIRAGAMTPTART